MHKIDRLLQKISDLEAKFVDFRFTDSFGKVHHMTFDAEQVDGVLLEEGIILDGSSLPNCRSINQSDMLIVPDISTAHIDPFLNDVTLAIFCNLKAPSEKDSFNRDPRSIAQKAESYLKNSGIADTAYIGPEPEFFLFDDIKFSTNPYRMGFSVDSEILHDNNDNDYESGNLGHRPLPQSSYAPLPPLDRSHEIRSQMLTYLKSMGVITEKHHSEVASAQQELGIKYDSLIKIADKVQIYKYVVHQVAYLYGKTATFMPKPIYKASGSGMHVHISLWKNQEPVFSGDEYANLSQECLYFIGGILKHAKALNAFTNPTTNSYKRLVPGYEAPVLLAYSSQNRSAAIRIPYSTSRNSKRIEVRFPDPSANPYLAFAAVLMAGLDGIENKICPGQAKDENLYKLEDSKLQSIPRVAASLDEALSALDKDRAFLTKQEVFTDDFIDAYINTKKEEIHRLMATPHPVEFDMYYSI